MILDKRYEQLISGEYETIAAGTRDLLDVLVDIYILAKDGQHPYELTLDDIAARFKQIMELIEAL